MLDMPGMDRWEAAMRVVLGIVLGFFLTIGITYIADSGRHAACPAVEGRPLVNWDEVDLRLGQLGATIERGWHRLTGH
jgi:hypothetical protein